MKGNVPLTFVNVAKINNERNIQTRGGKKALFLLVHNWMIEISKSSLHSLRGNYCEKQKSPLQSEQPICNQSLWVLTFVLAL